MELWLIKDDSGVKTIQRNAEIIGFEPESISIAQSEKEGRRLIDEVLDSRKPPPEIAVIDPHLTPCKDRLEDGITLIGDLRKIFRDCTIICLTVSGNVSLAVKAFKMGADDFIDCSWPYVNWVVYTREKLALWKAARDLRNQAAAE